MITLRVDGNLYQGLCLLTDKGKDAPIYRRLDTMMVKVQAGRYWLVAGNGAVIAMAGPFALPLSEGVGVSTLAKINCEFRFVPPKLDTKVTEFNLVYDEVLNEGWIEDSSTRFRLGLDTCKDESKQTLHSTLDTIQEFFRVDRSKGFDRLWVTASSTALLVQAAMKIKGMKDKSQKEYSLYSIWQISNDRVAYRLKDSPIPLYAVAAARVWPDVELEYSPGVWG